MQMNGIFTQQSVHNGMRRTIWGMFLSISVLLLVLAWGVPVAADTSLPPPTDDLITSHFQATRLPPTITSLTPRSGLPNTTVSFTITGDRFQVGSRVTFVNSPIGNLTPTLTSTTRTRIRGRLVIPTGRTGRYGLEVRRPDGLFAYRPGLFMVRSALPPGPVIAGVPIFPSDHIWNVRVDTLPRDPASDLYVATIGEEDYLHPDFGSGLWDGHTIGIPYNVVDGTQEKVAVEFYYPGESDAGPYPIPDNPAIEGGSDRHILIVHTGEKKAYELYDASLEGGTWHAGSGAIFDLTGYALRPRGWTSADAAGLAILPGLVRYEEVASGEIKHAIRVTAPETRKKFVWPARHYASSLTNARYPPMGQRFRLKADVDISGFPQEDQVILTALKTYGMILVDNGAPWYITGVPDERWDNDVLHHLQELHGSDFEAVDVSSLMISENSGQARV
jgi:hypothetical protein